MKLRLGVARYLEFKQSLGMRFETAGYTLRAFCRAMGSIDLGCVKPDKVAAFLLCNGQMTSGWHYKRIIATPWRFLCRSRPRKRARR